MSKIMLINVIHVEESRVAILEDGVLAAYEIETINRTSIKGNIYNAVVESVHPGLEAAFVRIGSDLKGFLPIDEINFRLLPSRDESRARGRIGQHLQQGQRLMVQVVREPFAGKPPTVSTYFSLPGRYLVLMPGVDSGGISRKIGDTAQRDRLKEIIDELKLPDGFGLIVRTAGIGRTKTELQRDLKYLLRLWEAIQKGSGAGQFPGPVYRDRDLVIRTIRDHFTPDIAEVWIDSTETYEKALEFMKDVMPTRAKTLRLYTGDRPLFNKYNLEEQIETIYKRRVPLPSGGEIVIDGTEALTAIDVNSARTKRKMEAEENATQTNLEAATEIARQFRLRDLGGLVVIDFIDMMASKNRKKVEKTMRDAMKGDKSKYDLTSISKLGLMEISRQRLKGEKMGATYATCTSCDGYGLLKTIEAAGLAALRKIQTRSARGGFGRLMVALPPKVAEWMLNSKREEILGLEKRHGIQIAIEAAPSLLRHECEFKALAAEAAAEPPAAERDGRPAPAAAPDLPAVEPAAPTPVAKDHAPTPNKPQEEPPGDPAATDGTAESNEEAPRKRRRRRRRRKPKGAGNQEGTSEPRNDADAAPEPAPEPAPESVPERVISNELMPAAVGAAEGQRNRSGKNGSRRGKRG